VSITTFHSDLEKLIRKFEADQQHYSSKDYLEAQARMDLITPFFNLERIRQEMKDEVNRVVSCLATKYAPLLQPIEN
jgi:PleD family two-component response regulator